MENSDRKTTIECEITDNVATLTISFPERRNPIGTDTAGLLTAQLHAMEANGDVRTVVITGAGTSFSSGGDLHEFLATTSATSSDHWQSGEIWGNMYRKLLKFPKPTISKVRGPALAGGCGIVAACDFAIAAEGATFATPEAGIGLFPLFILPALVRTVGRRNALDMSLTARTISAAEAVEIGLLNRVVPDRQLDQEVLTLARRLANIGPLTMSMGKRAFNEIADLGIDRGLEAARDLRVPFMGSPELRAGIEKFLRKPSKTQT